MPSKLQTQVYFLLFSAFLLCSTIPLHAQLIKSVPFPKMQTLQQKTPGFTRAKKDTIRTVARMIKEFNQSKNKTIARMNDLKLKLKDTSISAIRQVQDNIKKIDSASNTPDISSLQLDTIPVAGIAAEEAPPGEPQELSTNCNDVQQVSGLKSEKQYDGTYLFTLYNNNDNPIKSFVLKQYNEKLFNDELAKALFGFCKESVSQPDSDQVNNLLNELTKMKLFDQMLIASLEVDNNRDLAGTMSVHKHLPMHYPEIKKPDLLKHLKKEVLIFPLNEQISNTNNNSNTVNAIDPGANVSLNKTGNMITDEDRFIRFTVFGIQLHFQDGFIENIQVTGKLENDTTLLQFGNIYPISFTTRHEYGLFMKVRLYEKTSLKKLNVYLTLEELISYIPNFAIDTKDYSPANQVYPAHISNNVTEDITTINLYKEETSKILEAKIFSDLKGIDGDNPNGLIQLELSKKLNLLSRRYRIFHSYDNFGFLNYITPQFGMNKIESNQRRFVLPHFNDVTSPANSSNPLTYASTINLLRHQIFNVGFDLSVLLLDFTGLKSTVNIGTGVYFGRTALQDTLRTNTAPAGGRPSFEAQNTNNVSDFSINTFQWNPFFITWQIYPNKKYGVNVTQRLISFKALNADFAQVRDSAQYVRYIRGNDGNDAYKSKYVYANNRFGKCLASTEIFAFFKTSENNKLFFRYRLNWDVNYSKENFQQLQIGLATYLTSTKESRGSSAVTPP